MRSSTTFRRLNQTRQAASYGGQLPRIHVTLIQAMAGTEHAAHIATGGHISGRQALLEMKALAKDVSHVRHLRHIPARQALIETVAANEHATHVRELCYVPVR